MQGHFQEFKVFFQWGYGVILRRKLISPLMALRRIWRSNTERNNTNSDLKNTDIERFNRKPRTKWYSNSRVVFWIVCNLSKQLPSLCALITEETNTSNLLFSLQNTSPVWLLLELKIPQVEDKDRKCIFFFTNIKTCSNFLHKHIKTFKLMD